MSNQGSVSSVSSTIKGFFWTVVTCVVGIIVATFVVFIIDGRFNTNGIDPNIFGQFGDFIAGVAGTLINFTAIIFLYLTYQAQKREVEETKKLTRLQMELGMKPELYFNDASLYVYAETIKNGVTYPALSTQKANVEGGKLLDLRLINVGVGTAKEVKSNWEYDIDKVYEYIESRLSSEDFELTLKREAWGGVSLSYPGTSQRWFKPFTHDQTHNYILPYKQKEDLAYIVYPIGYLELYVVAFQLAAIKVLDTASYLADFPECRLNVRYLDMANNVYSRTFILKFAYSYYMRPDQPGDLMMQGLLSAKSFDQ
ncbi:hypothetical protein GZH53_15780 [Flavihumibacter sp. R14]|nr:hypothetical protein [Flavihumibacter soli]